MGEPVRVGLIGAGIMGADHARILAADIPGAVLSAVCDRDAERAAAVASQHGADALVDPAELIARDDVGAVLIASPDPTHGPLTLDCIAAGKPVLCEKPLSPDPAECRAVVEAEIAGGRRLVHIGFMRRFDPSYAAMKRTLEEGTIGRALMLHCIHRNAEAPHGFTGAMAITNSAPHEFDVARFLLGTEPVAITAWQPRREGMVAPVVMVIETDASQLVTIEINNEAAYGYDVRGELVGETGTVSLRAPVEIETNLALANATPYPVDWRPRFAEAYRLQARTWVGAVRADEPSPTAASAWDGLVATLVAEAGACALAEERRSIIEIPARPAFYRDREG